MALPHTAQTTGASFLNHIASSHQLYAASIPLIEDTPHICTHRGEDRDDFHGFCPSDSCGNLLFSQMFSIRFSPGARNNGKTTFHGFSNIAGSS
jgi:hypothetical protein